MNQLSRCLLVFVAGFFIAYASYATHIRGGEISYTFDPASPLRVTFTIKIYRNIQGVPLGSINLNLGDGQVVLLESTTVQTIGNETEEARYLTTHTFAGPGTYTASVQMDNRTPGVVNITTDSRLSIMYLRTQVLINPQLAGNRAAYFAGPPIFRAKAGVPFRQHLLAFDPDGDSLSYQLIPCLGGDGLPVPGYFYPDSIAMDAVSGDFIWDTPTEVGLYNFAAEVTEWRGGAAVSKIMKDFQVLVEDDAQSNQQLIITQSSVPELLTANKVSLAPGTPVQFTVVFSDTAADSVFLATYGELLDADSSVMLTVKDSLQFRVATVSWQPDSADVRNYPYVFVFRGQSYYDAASRIIESDLTVALFVGSEVVTAPGIVLPPGPNPPPDPHVAGVLVFPNPATTTTDVVTFRITFPTDPGRITLQIVDAVGREIGWFTAVGNAEIRLDARLLSLGMYVYRVWDERDRHYQGRFVKLQ